MTEEVKNEALEAPQLTTIEQKASEQGWVPQDQWDGEPDAWRPAKEFLDRGELFKKIDDQNRVIKQLKHTQELFARHHDKVRETEYKRALSELKAKKRDAYIEGEIDKVLEIDEEIEAVKVARSIPAPQPQPEPAVNPVFTAWVQKNSWYNDNKAMRAFADKLGNELGAAGGISPSDLLTEVESQVKKEFAHKFQNPRRQQAAAVEGEGKAGAGKSQKAESFELSAEEEKACTKFVKTIPGYTREKYIQEIKRMRGVS